MSSNIALRNLIEKYLDSIPRYTSYPTAVEFHTGVNNQCWQKELEEEFKKDNNDLSLYLHVPFCHSLCYYCACNKVIAKDDSLVVPYINAVKSELGAYQELISKHTNISQFHWGGGTPNFLSPKATEELFSILKLLFQEFLNKPKSQLR